MLSSCAVGVGLRKEHYTYLLSQSPHFETIAVDWFEILTENYLFTQGRPRQVLDALRERFPITCHGVSLNVASAQPLDLDYVHRLKDFVNHYQPERVSDHLCWTGWPEHQMHNLLPFPYTQQTLSSLAERIQQIQEILQRPVAFENLSAYFAFPESEMTEAEFLAALATTTGCLILLDINNLYVNSHNFKTDPVAYLACLPADKVVQYHLAGYQSQTQNNHQGKGLFLFDTHSAPVYPDVWALYAQALAIIGPRPTLIEWDDQVPDFERLQAEALLAKEMMIS